MSAYTYSNTRTFARAQILENHFRMFLQCAQMSDNKIQNMLAAVRNKEIVAVGIYLEDGGKMVAEVEFRVDWEKHMQMVRLYGEQFNVNRGGFRNGIAPEAYVAVQQLVEMAEDTGKTIYSWIEVSPQVSSSSTKHGQVLRKLGYCWEPPPQWKSHYLEDSRTIHYLEEAQTTLRYIETLDW